MRVRTLMTLVTGAAAGAGAMYLLDPEHGPHRRREARHTALRTARQGATSALLEGRRRLKDVAVAATTGYHEARSFEGDGRSRTSARPGW
jgi:hypothetical protein